MTTTLTIFAPVFLAQKRKEEETHRDAPLARAYTRIYTYTHIHTRDEAQHRGRWATIAEYRRRAADDDDDDREASRPGGGVIFIIVCWISRPVVGR